MEPQHFSLMCRADVKAQISKNDTKQGTKRKVHVIFKVLEKEMCSHVLQQQLLTADFTGEHGCNLRTQTLFSLCSIKMIMVDKL